MCVAASLPVVTMVMFLAEVLAFDKADGQTTVNKSEVSNWSKNSGKVLLILGYF